jgi:hypothetical protein
MRRGAELIGPASALLDTDLDAHRRMPRFEVLGELTEDDLQALEQSFRDRCHENHDLICHRSTNVQKFKNSGAPGRPARSRECKSLTVKV